VVLPRRHRPGLTRNRLGSSGVAGTRDGIGPVHGPYAPAVVPTWVAILTAVSGAVVGLFVAPVTEVVKARAARVQARDAAQVQDRRDAAKSNRELILKALEWTDSERPETKERGWTMLVSLARLPSLSKDDAVLVADLTRSRAGAQLSEAAARRQETGEETAFFVGAGAVLGGQRDRGG
jgi:hypothetical protein